MSRLNLTAQTKPSTPGTNTAELYLDSVDENMRVVNDQGYVCNVGMLCNFSTASQAPAATTRTYITGSKITVPSGKLQIGTCLRWTFDITKTAAGTATSTYDICFGTNGTTADTARVSFTKPAGTAAVDTGIVTITAVVRGPLSASGIVSGNFQLVKNAAATAGHLPTPSCALNTISSGFDVTVANLFVGVCITTGASDAITIQQCVAEAWNL
jgi:hypothetical protein